MYLLILVFTAFLGLAIGSFLNVVILRSISGNSLKGRSECPNCHHQLGFWDLIPLFSFLWLRGKCRYCRKKISVQYPLVEVSTLLLFLFATSLVLLTFNFQPNLTVYFVLLAQLIGIGVLVAVFVTDLRWGLIPNRIIIPGILLLIGVKLVYFFTVMSLTYFDLANDPTGLGKYLLPPHSEYYFSIAQRLGMPIVYDLVIGLAIGLVFTSLIVLTKGRAMGGGDIKLGFFVGVLNGWPLALVALLIGFVSGAVISILLLMLGKKRFGQTIPFGPFLVLGSLITLFWGNQLFNWYLGLIG